MPGDSMKRVANSSPVQMTAQWWNRVTDATLKSEKDKTLNSAGQPGIHVPEGLIYVQNNSGQDRKRFEILGIHDILFSPADNLTEFQNNAALVGVTPTSAHIGYFVICAEPIANKAVGRAFIFGTCPVQISMQHSQDQCADVLPNDATQLQSATRGAVQILWNQSGTGTQWALVRFGSYISNGIFRVNLTQTGGTAGSSTAAPSWVYTVTDDDGNTLGTNMTPARGRDYNGKRNAGAYGYGEYIGGNFVLLEAWESPTTFKCS